MLAASTEVSEVVDAVRGGHAALEGSVAELRHLCVTMRAGTVRAATPREMLERFSSLVVRHFVEEERDECFGSLLMQQPRLLHRVKHLQEEHVEMADAVTQLLDFERNEGEGPELAARLERLLDRLAVHEHAENALMQELLLVDEGESGD